ncbi:hypothetical protein AgCh_036554 [Apium graveolens]
MCEEVLWWHPHNFKAYRYPFCNQRLDFLKSEDAVAARQPSLHTLLTSSKRDYLISNNEDQVPIHTLEDKVVALYFYEEGFSDEKVTKELQMAYKELARNNKKFEVVLVYRFDGLRTWAYKSDESFWKTFKTMPWLALPNEDSHHRMLKQIFNFSYDNDGKEFVVVIIGPHMEFIEPFGVFILQNFKISAYPFSRDRVAELITEEAKQLRLEMLWEPNSVFGGKFGFEHGTNIKVSAGNEFININGVHFILNGSYYYINGFNMYWLMVVASDPSQRDKVSFLFQEAVSNGLTLARTWAFNDGGSQALQFSPSVYNE